MNDDRIAMLEREIAQLRTELEDVRSAISIVSNSTTDSLVSLHQSGITVSGNLKRLNDWVTTLIYKVMPEHEGTREQIDSILGRETKNPPPG